MKKGKEYNILNKCIALVAIFLMFVSSSFAAENSLSGVDIKHSVDNGYKVFLKVDKKAKVNKVIEGNDNLSLVISSTLPSESIDIVYDSEDNFSNVIVQKKNDNNTLISLQGKNISEAQIYTQELSTGITKLLDENNATLLGIIDKKVLGFVLFCLIFALFNASSKSKNKKKVSTNANKMQKTIKNSANTLRNKNLVQSKNIPSINYKVNGSFNSVNSHITTPKDFVINNQPKTIKEMKVRKAG